MARGIEHGGQKKKGKRERRGVQMWYRADDQCDQGCHNDPFLILVESVHPPVSTSEREQNGTRYGGYQNSLLPEVSACIDIVI